MRIVKILFSVTAGMAIFGGCGAITQEVVLHDSKVNTNYIAQPDSSKLLFFTGLADNRAEKTSIGYEMNGKGEHTVIVKSRNDVWKWVNREIVLELKQKGFLFMPVNTPAEKIKYSLSGNLLRVSEVMYNDYLAEVVFDAKITCNGRVLVEKKYTGKKKSAMNEAPSADLFNKSLRSALLEAVNQLAGDVDSCCRLICREQDTSKADKVDSGASNQVNAADVADTMKESGVASLSQGTAFSEDLCPQERNKVVILQGKRSKYAIKQILDSIRNEVSSFYRKRQKENPGFLGTMCLHLIIEPDGRVSTLNAIVSSDDGQFSREVQKRFSAIDFGTRSSDTVPTEILYSLDLGNQRTESNDAAVALRAVSILISLLISLVLIPSITHPY